jgi:6-phosphogluconate dehydrogenase
MGSGFAQRLSEKGYEVAGFDQNPDTRSELKKLRLETSDSLEKLVAILTLPRTILLSVPYTVLDDVLFGNDGLAKFLSGGDFVIDATNSYYKDSIRRSSKMREKGVDYLDTGVSGGPAGAKTGACIMVGGNEKVYAKLEPLFKDLAAPEGYAYIGPSGSGHFVKMVHNGIEYALIQAYTEGFELLNAGPYKELDFRKISQLWNHGAVVASFLLDKIEAVFAKDPRLETIEGFVEDFGEGRWAVKEAVESEVPVDTITRALFARFRSRQKDSFAAKLTAAMRHEFGGHAVKKRK